MNKRLPTSKFLKGLAIYSVFAATSLGFVGTTPVAQAQNDYRSFDVSSVFDGLSTPPNDSLGVNAGQYEQEDWWDQHVMQSQRRAAQPLPTDIHSLMYLALKYSNELRIAADDPIIRETAIVEADSNFDWVRYLDGQWNDTNEPVSSSLITGDDSRFFDEETFQATAGVRRNTRSGGQLDISQRYGYQDNNSTFFIPSDQASGQLTLSYSHPLLRGRGQAYNESIVVLAQLDTGVAHDEFLAVLQEHLLEITRSYWALYQERAQLAQQTSLFLKTQDVVNSLRARQKIDAQRTQFVTASSALESRRADLIRARTAVVNAETRLRGLINAPELNVAELAEIVPIEPPTYGSLGIDLQTELQNAIQNRPEVHAAIKQIKQATVRLGVAQNEMLPLLNLVTQGYLSGLRGNSDFREAFSDQFSTGRPSYSVGIQYEMPIGNRLAKARLTRQAAEMRRLQSRYALALTAIQTEVDIAVRELNTSHREIRAKRRALSAAEAEAATIEARWSKMVGGAGQSGLNLESLLRAQERVTASEREYVTSLLTYNLAIINLKRATGTLLQSENVTVGRAESSHDAPSLILDKSPSNEQQYGNGGGGFEEMGIPYETYDQGYGQANPQQPQQSDVRQASFQRSSPNSGTGPAMNGSPQAMPSQPHISGRYPLSSTGTFRPGSIGTLNNNRGQ